MSHRSPYSTEVGSPRKGRPLPSYSLFFVPLPTRKEVEVLLNSIKERMHLGRVGFRYGVSIRTLAEAGWSILYSATEVLDQFQLASDDAGTSTEAIPPDWDTRASIAPASWDTPTRTKELLFRLTRAVQPETIIEIGVANGASTRVFLQAVNINNKGLLHSYDLNHNCKKVIDVGDAARWEFHWLCGGRNSYIVRQIANSIREFEQIDILFCDADFRTDWRIHEFNLALEFLSPGGYLILRGIDTSRACSDFMMKHPWVNAVLLADTLTFTGILQRPLEEPPVGPSEDSRDEFHHSL